MKQKQQTVWCGVNKNNNIQSRLTKEKKQIFRLSIMTLNFCHHSPLTPISIGQQEAALTSRMVVSEGLIGIQVQRCYPRPQKSKSCSDQKKKSWCESEKTSSNGQQTVNIKREVKFSKRRLISFASNPFMKEFNWKPSSHFHLRCCDKMPLTSF